MAIKSGRKMLKRKEKIVFDDDVSSSSDEDEQNLVEFNSALQSQIPKRIADHDSQSDEADAEDSDNSEGEASEEDEEDSDVEPAKPIIDASKFKEKMSGLKSLLNSIDHTAEAPEEESESEESEEEIAMEKSAKPSHKVKPGKMKRKVTPQLSQPRQEEEEDQEEPDEIPPKKMKAKKRKNDSSEVPSTKEAKLSKDAQERQSIRDELRHMSLDEIQELKEKIGLKLYNQALGHSGSKSTKLSKAVFKRENKNRPREISSKKPVKRFRDVVGLSAEMNDKSRGVRDPRFDSMCGEFDPKLFKDSYKFVDDIKVRERRHLEKQLESEADPEEIEKIKYLIQRHDNQVREKKLLESRETIKKQSEGRGTVSKNLEMVSQYEDLKKRGKLDSYIKKKNKKSLAKERRTFDTVK